MGNKGRSYIISSSSGAMHDQVGHVSDQVGGQSEVEEHVNNGKRHLPCVLSMQVSVPHGAQGGD